LFLLPLFVFTGELYHRNAIFAISLLHNPLKAVQNGAYSGRKRQEKTNFFVKDGVCGIKSFKRYLHLTKNVV
jgi:hypothetical protein